MWTTNRHNEPSLAMAEMLRIPAPSPAYGLAHRYPASTSARLSSAKVRNSGSLIRFSTSSLGDSKRFSKREYLQSRCGRTTD
jgi:hypothetical protein